MKHIHLNSDISRDVSVLNDLMQPGCIVTMLGHFICTKPIIVPPGAEITGLNGCEIHMATDSFEGDYFSIFHTPWEKECPDARISCIDFWLEHATDRKLAVGACNLYGSNIRIHDCMALVVSTSETRESFAFSINPYYHGKNPIYGASHNRISDCEVRVARATKTAVTAFLLGSAVGLDGGGVFDNWLLNGSIERCRVTGLVDDPTDPEQQIHAFSMSGCRNGRVSDCIAKDVAFGFYCDTGSTDTLTIDRLTALNVVAGCYWNLGKKDMIGYRAPLGHVVIRDPYVTLNPNTTRRLVGSLVHTADDVTMTMQATRRLAGVLVHAADEIERVADSVIIDGGCIGWDRHLPLPSVKREAFGVLVYKTDRLAILGTRFELPVETRNNPTVGAQEVAEIEVRGVPYKTVRDYTQNKWL